MWWADLLWGLWNGLTAWVVLSRPRVRWLGAVSRSTTRQGAVTGTTSGFCSAAGSPLWVPMSGDAEGAR
jgi:hypothetical protein